MPSTKTILHDCRRFSDFMFTSFEAIKFPVSETTYKPTISFPNVPCNGTSEATERSCLLSTSQWLQSPPPCRLVILLKSLEARSWTRRLQFSEQMRAGNRAQSSLFGSAGRTNMWASIHTKGWMEMFIVKRIAMLLLWAKKKKKKKECLRTKSVGSIKFNLLIMSVSLADLLKLAELFWVAALTCKSFSAKLNCKLTQLCFS